MPLYIPENQEYKREIERIIEDAINFLVQADEIKKELFSKELSKEFLEGAPKIIIKALEGEYHEKESENFFEAYILQYTRRTYLDFRLLLNEEAKLKLKDGEHAFIENYEEDLIKKVRDGHSFLENELKLYKLLLLTYYYSEYEIRFQVRSKAKVNVIPKVNNKMSSIFLMVLLSIPFIWIVWHQQNFGLIIDTSKDILKIVISSTLGMLGLVITSATFMANFYKGLGGKRLEILTNFDALQEEAVKAKSAEEIQQLNHEYYKSNINNMLESSEAVMISGFLKNLSLFLLLFVCLALLALMITYIPNNFVWWLFTIFFISLDFIFFKILFTVLSIVRFIDNSLKANYSHNEINFKE